MLDVKNVVWCNGYQPNFSWIDLPVFGDHEPMHHRGIVASQPGLYFVELEFLYAVSSTMIQGVGREAEQIAKSVVTRTNAGPTHVDQGQVPTPMGVGAMSDQSTRKL